MATQRINDIDYSYETAGTGIPVVLLHGFTGSSGNWRGLMEHLAADYRVIAVDILGHGKTAVFPHPHRYTMPHAAADLAALLQLLNATPCHLLGYSMGGRLALYFAVHYPHLLRSLILESGSPGLATAAEREARTASDNALADRIEREGVPAFVDYWENIGLFASQKRLETAVCAQLRQQRLQNNPLGLANSLRGMGTGQQPSLWDDLPRLALPTLLIAGELDSKYVAIGRQMAAQLPQTQFVNVTDAGHTVHLERPEQFAALVGDWLA